MANELLRGLSVLAFLVAGMSCLRSSHMKREFERYELARYRTLTGILQLTGAAGLTLGLMFPALTPLASGGLSLLMFFGVVARVRVGDSLLAILPAASLSVLNLIILTRAVAHP